MLKIDFENQILALFDVYFWPFNKSHEKFNAIFVISAIMASVWNVFIKFRWHDQKLTVTDLYPKHPFGACCMLLETWWSQLLSMHLHFHINTAAWIWNNRMYNNSTKVGMAQRSYTKWLYKRIYKTEMSSGLFWAVGAAEKKKLPTAISKQLFQVVFSTFCGQNKFLKIF